MKRLPKFLYPLFWDINPKKLDVNKCSRYVIERIMERGDIPHIKWMLRSFSNAWFRKTLCNSHQLSKKAATFWSLFLKVPQKDILCLSKEFRKKHRAIWPY